MPRRILLMGITMLVAGIFSGCKPSRTNQSYGYFQTHWQDESQFIVENIVTDLAEQIYFAKFHRLPAAKYFFVSAVETNSDFFTPTYEVQIDLDKNFHGLKTSVQMSSPIWSPETYDNVVEKLANAVGLASAENSSSETRLLERLANGEATTIEEENKKISGELQNDFSNPVLHEEAAVLLGAFTLREHSGNFFEIRSPLCRITAHLTMARFLNNGQAHGINGQIAEVMALTLMNDEKEALDKIIVIPTNDAAVTKWTRALQTLNTKDYRLLEQENDLSRIESIAWFSALRNSANSDIAWSKLNDSQKRIPDFIRIASDGYYSVGLGHELLDLALPAEFEEFGNVYEMVKGKKLDEKKFITSLNELPDRCFSSDKMEVHVIGWGLWAGFFQRQFCHAVTHNFNFLQRQWSVPDDAKDFSDKCDKMFSKLRLYPFVRRFNCIDVATYHQSVDDGFKLTVTSPQLVPAECWNYLCYEFNQNERYTPNPNPHVNEWHKHNPPPGTAYNPFPRLDHPSLTGQSGAVDRLHKLAPYDWQIANYLWRFEYKKNPTHEQALGLYQPLLDYDDSAMERVALTLRDQPVEYEKLMFKAAEVNPSDFFALASYFKKRDADKAAYYIEKGTTLDPDAIESAEYAQWLIKFYLKNNRVDDARKEADFAGEVYSSVGLCAKAEFFEATGNYDGAFEWYAKNEERYDESGPLIAFCMRYQAKTGNMRFETEVQKRLKKLFPRGLENVSLKDFQSPPGDGVFFKEESDLLLNANLHGGDVIVAAYGVRVHNVTQYDYVRDSHSESDLDLIVWQNGAYHEIHADPPNHLFGVDIGDYVAH